ncbi:tripartite tricarboxylate transporter TctB family protein [Asanoa iriomotensis]|uniref:DUF1468 domain-containing protein n=1 Tax=Asanoa iriomotensis TaxID=234613 RepID=A0ABQ4BYC8_9ACTN|nr:tripartite tricarboxylate transporter TctB family protein [Asanoa iriomotensis]GIF55529.1 hypothetical protein Air01nite_16240 [Asanoa iriomotensis]
MDAVTEAGAPPAAPPATGRARLVHQATAVVFVAAAVYVAATAPGLGLYDGRGPGAGLFPFVVAIGWAVLSAVWFVQITTGRSAGTEGRFFDSLDGARRVALLAGGIILLAVALPILGFQLATFVFVALFLGVYGRHHWVVTAAVALGASFGLFTAFTRLLDVSLPVSSIPFLVDLGL